MFRSLFASTVILVCVHGLFGTSAPDQLRVVLVSGCNEYFSEISLTKYAQYLEKNRGVQVTLLQAGGPLNERGEYSELPGFDALAHADVALFFLRRTTISGEALAKIKEFARAGKGIVALRTSSHGLQNWLEFDKEVLGGNYNGHYEGTPETAKLDARQHRQPVGEPKAPALEARVIKEQASHPLLAGIVNFQSRYSLYKTSPVAADAQVLMTGQIPDQQPEPIVWCRSHYGGRVVYIGLGGLQDWENPTFRRLVTNAIAWAGKKPAPEKVLPNGR